MTDGTGQTRPPGMAALLEDWVTIWHSELAAMVADRELQEAGLRLIDAWAAGAMLAARTAGSALDAAGHAGAAAPPGSAPIGDAAGQHDGRDAVIAGLLDRVAELERRLARLDDPGPA